MDEDKGTDLTGLLIQYGKGDKSLLDKILPRVYKELHSLAARHMSRERRNHTLQPTALVHEAFLRLIDQNSVKWNNRAHFLGVASQLMRRILTDYARSKKAEKRGGGGVAVSFDEAFHRAQGTATSDQDLIALDEALKKLSQLNSRQSAVLELRYFGGLTIEETAEFLKVSTATVERDWSLAKAWLYRELSKKAA